jgi:hypothetical protein
MTTPSIGTPTSVELWLLAVYINQEFTLLNERIDKLMTDVVVQQEALDALAASLEAVKDTLATEIANLQTQLPAGSLQGIQTALDDLQSLEPPASAPATPPAPADASGGTTDTSTTPPIDAPPA